MDKGLRASFLKDPAVYDEARKTIAGVHKLVDDLNAGKGTAGQLLKSEDLSNQLKETISKIDSMLDKVNSGQGTIGQLLVNQQLYDNLNGATREMHLSDEGFPGQSRRSSCASSSRYSRVLKYLIPNADDFGYTRDVNEGIIHAHRQGILTATTLMATGAAFDHAVALARENPGLDVGVHLVLVGGDGLPASVAELMPQIALGRIRIYDELSAQVRKVLERRSSAEPFGYAQAHPLVAAGAGCGGAHRGRVRDSLGAPSIRLSAERRERAVAKADGEPRPGFRARAVSSRPHPPRLPHHRSFRWIPVHRAL